MLHKAVVFFLTFECLQNDAAETDSQGNSADLDDLSELSNLSGLSEEAWQPVAGKVK